MDPNKTWIDAPKQRSAPPPPSAPSEPPERPPRDRNWVGIAVVMGGIILVLCVVIGFLAYQYLQGEAPSIDFGDPTTEAVSEIGLTQTALVADIQLGLTPTLTEPPPPTDEPTPAPPTDTPPPSLTPTETLVPTSSIPLFTANQALLCRQGPSTIYKDVRTLDAGIATPILGKGISPVDGVSIWWLVEVGGLQCYVSSGFGTTEGDTSGVPTIPPPPTPTPTPTLTPTTTPTPTATPP